MVVKLTLKDIVDMKEQERQELGAKLLFQLNELFEGDDALPTVASRMKTLESSVAGLKGVDIRSAVENFDKIRASVDSLTKQIRNHKGGVYVPGIEDEAEKFSFHRCLIAASRKDWRLAPAEKEVIDAVRAKAAQSIGDDTLGGYFVPDQVIPDVIAAIYTASTLINLAGDGTTLITVLDGLSGGNVKIPKFNGGTVAFWIGEEDEYTESLTTVGDLHMNPKKAGVLVKLTDSMRRFTGFGFERLIRNDMTRALAKLIDYTAMYGNGGDNSPRGAANNPDILLYSAQSNATVTHTVTAIAAANSGDWTGGELDPDDLANIQLIMEEASIPIDATARWVSAPRFFKRLKELKIDNYSAQTVNRPYLLGAPIMRDSTLSEIIGPFSKMNQIPTAVKPGASVGAPSASGTLKHTDMLYGMLSQIILGRWGGIEIDDDAGKGVGFTTDHTYLKVRMYCDIGFRDARQLMLCPDAKVRD